MHIGVEYLIDVREMFIRNPNEVEILIRCMVRVFTEIDKLEHRNRMICLIDRPRAGICNLFQSAISGLGINQIQVEDEKAKWVADLAPEIYNQEQVQATYSKEMRIDWYVA